MATKDNPTNEVIVKDPNANKDPFANVVLTRKQGGRKSLSTVAKVKAKDSERAELQAFYMRLLPTGTPMPTYVDSWEDYLIAGHISTDAFIKWVRGDKGPATEQAFDTGVRIRKGQRDKYEREGGQLNANRFGDGNWSKFVGLAPKAQYDHLVSKGAL